jgi:hyperosmotically inducible protein
MVFAVACSQSDIGITSAVKSKFAADDTVKAYQIHVDTKDRVVTLTGAVETSAAKDQAVALARQTEGVRDVVDQLVVSPPVAADTRPAEPPGIVGDAAITSAVKAKLLADSDVSGLKIDVDTSAGVVTLDGTVGTKAEKTKAVAIARETDGVTQVVDKLRVRG